MNYLASSVGVSVLCLIVSLQGCGYRQPKQQRVGGPTTSRSTENADPLTLDVPTKDVPTHAPNGFPYCTNGSDTGGGWGWDPGVTDPRGSHSCVIPPQSQNPPPPSNGGGGGETPEPVGGSPGCRVPGRDLGLRNVSIRVGSTQRTFIRMVKNNYDSKRKHALVIGFHGYGLDGTSPRAHHKWPMVEEMAGDEAIFIYPNALGGSWNAASGSSPDVLFFDEIVRTTGDLYCIDKNRVFIHGFSNGGFFVNGLAGLRTGAVRAVIAVAGGGGGAKIPAMVIHGTGDPNVGYYFGQQSVSAYARANGCNTNINFGAMKMGECQTIIGCGAENPTWFCPWNGPHHWPEFTLPNVWGFISSFK